MSVDDACRLVAGAQRCVLLVGSGVSARLELQADPEPRAASSDLQRAIAELRAGTGSGGSGVAALAARLAAAQRLVRVYTDDVRPLAAAPSEQQAGVDARTVCIHGRIDEFACRACAATGRMTQAALDAAGSGAEVACGACQACGPLATGPEDAAAAFVPSIHRAQCSERAALAMARADAAARIDLLLVLGAPAAGSEAWGGLLHALAASAARTIAVGETALDGVETIAMDAGAFAQYLLNADGGDGGSHGGLQGPQGLQDHQSQNHQPRPGGRRAKGRGRDKTSLTHLLGFRLPARVPPPPGLGRPRRRAAEGPVSERQAEASRKAFINANFRFVLRARHWSSFMAVGERPDMQLRAEWIERVLMPVAGGDSVTCPICLSCPTAARITKCGHVFCLPCIMRHQSYGAERCPVCWCAISADALLPVHPWAVRYDIGAGGSAGPAGLAAGAPIAMRLMKRQRGTTTCLPRRSSPACAASAAAAATATRFPWTFTEGALPFARVMLAASAYSAAEYERELHELRRARDAEDAGSEPRLFIEAALASVEDALQSARAPGPAEARLEAQALAAQAEAESGSPAEPAASGSDGASDNRSDSSSSSSGDDDDDDFIYFYQADDGQHVYMHPLHVRILAHDRGGYAELPDAVELRVRHAVESVVTDEVRRRMRFLGHLSLRCEVVIVEPELKHAVSRETLDAFRPQLAHHDRQHAARARAAALDEARAEAMAAAAQAAAAQAAADADAEMLAYSSAAASGAEAAASDFPALGDAAPPTPSPGSARAQPPRTTITTAAAGALWPRHPPPQANGAYSGLWDEFERAAAATTTAAPADEYDAPDHYEDQYDDLDDIAVATKDAPTHSAGGRKRHGRKKEVKLVLAGSNMRRSR
ncbi:hypothetical protein H4R18_000191 [Coemansia javaensis]|uniref:RING-type domain-containing protein n=1 Tax=Coemansia javaensis TaxID=2761396 RepID=A0A9W8HHI0_9FUNG|nr:hypothetical protein H4R18_000191 [Coemansia javaensis]